MSNTNSKIDINPSLANENTMYCKQVKILELHSSFNNALRSTCLEVRKEYSVSSSLSEINPSFPRPHPDSGIYKNHS